MPIYQWTGKNKRGKIQKVEMELANEEAVKNRLVAQKITPVKIKEKPKDLFENISFLQPKVKEADIILLARQFSTMIDAGLPIIQCIDILYSQQENKTFKVMLKKIKEAVESGSTLAEALKKYPNHFDDLFVNMIAAGDLRARSRVPWCIL
jgi:type IV pilus assembly protein PilC